MTLKDMISDVRARVRELAPRELTDDLIKHWLNAGQHDVASKTLCLGSLATNQTSEGEALYALPTDILRIRDVRCGGRQLAEIPSSMRDDSAGVPAGYVLLGRTELLLSPKPGAVETLEITYYKLPPDMVNLTDTCALPKNLHEAVVIYAVIRASESNPNQSDGTIAVSDRLRAAYNSLLLGQFRQRKPSVWRVERAASDG